MIKAIEGQKIAEGVSPEMLQEAKNLRQLATLIEGGTAYAVAYAWVQDDVSGGGESFSTFCGDKGALKLVGTVAILQRKLVDGVIEQG